MSDQRSRAPVATSSRAGSCWRSSRRRTALLDGTTQDARGRATRTWTRTRRIPLHGLEEALGLKRPKIPTHRAVRRDRGRVHRVRADLLLQRDRLAAQHRQPAAARPARQHPDHLRAGGAAGRRRRRSWGSSRWRSCRSPTTRSSSPRSSRARRSTRSSCRSSCRPAPTSNARCADVRAAGATVGRDRRGVRAMTGACSTLLARRCARARCPRRPACDENILDPMADSQPKANRYQESKFFDDGLAMQAPPEGTVPRERITLNAGPDDRPRGRRPDPDRTASRCRCTRRRCRCP